MQLFLPLQVEETDFDRLHSEQQTQGDNKYSTIQKVRAVHIYEPTQPVSLIWIWSGFSTG
jgi:hypothetical protein